jgi:serine protease Do
MTPGIIFQHRAARRLFSVLDRFLSVALILTAVALHSSAVAQTKTQTAEPAPNTETRSPSHTTNLLRQFNASLVTLIKNATPAVVQVMVTSYGPIEHGNGTGQVALFARQHDIGSGVILDSDGYIITNAHVIEGAQRIRVALNPPWNSAGSDFPSSGEHKVLEAKLVGVDKDIDLALLKIEARNLPTLALAATRPVYPGELVLAVGSPEALQSSVTSGVVSSVARQLDSNEAAVYIQTDAAINPGNSGGPLIDVDGYVIGLNTMILTEGGGSEGLGFAIPAATVKFVYESLRKYGRVHRIEIRAYAQEITPVLAKGLGLSQDWGVIISDVEPDGPAALAGIQAGDVVVSVDSRRVAGLPDFAAALYQHPPDELVSLDVLRGEKEVALKLPAVQHANKPDHLEDLIDARNLIGRLGVFVHDLDDSVRDVLPADVRIRSGVIVLAQSSEVNSYTSSLRAGDILHALNRTPIDSVHQLQSLLQGMNSGQAVVVQIERAGKLQYIAFDWGD